MDKSTIALPDAESTSSCGASLAHTLYTLPVTICLQGELGAGKTTFLQGFARALGVHEHLVSPTYALEQRYPSDHGELIHIDCYRLTPAQARELLRATDGHGAIRCVEWSERLPEESLERLGPHITVSLDESDPGSRTLHCIWNDAVLPMREQILEWRRDVRLPPHIAAHCDAVADFADALAARMVQDGSLVRREALRRASEAHDLLRFIDFRAKAKPAGAIETEEDLHVWSRWKEHFGPVKHEPACARFLREHGYGAVADIVETHGLTHHAAPRTRTEQKLLFYADKRVCIDRVVSLEERFRDFNERYTDGKHSSESAAWFAEAKTVERELFPGGCPL